jgi:hypothetical protein
VSQKSLEHGTIVGLRCPHCPLVAQRPDPAGWGDGEHHETGNPTPLGGLEAHMRVVHPELYEAWVATFR